LKSPDSDEQDQGNPSLFAWIGLVLLEKIRALVESAASGVMASVRGTAAQSLDAFKNGPQR
jgi:hypothetical protein